MLTARCRPRELFQIASCNLGLIAGQPGAPLTWSGTVRLNF